MDLLSGGGVVAIERGEKRGEVSTWAYITREC